MYHSPQSVTMTCKIPSGVKNHRKPGLQIALICFLPLDSLCMTLSWWFWHKTAAFYTELFEPHHFCATLKSQRCIKPPSKRNFGFILQYHILIYLHAKHLSMTKFLNCKIVEVKLVWLLCMEKWRAGFAIQHGLGAW